VIHTAAVGPDLRSRPGHSRGLEAQYKTQQSVLPLANTSGRSHGDYAGVSSDCLRFGARMRGTCTSIERAKDSNSSPFAVLKLSAQHATGVLLLSTIRSNW